MIDIVSLAGILVGVAGIWFGVKRIELSRYWKAVLSVCDLVLLVVGLTTLGKTGAVAFVLANILGAIGYGLSLAAEKEDILANAAAVSGSDMKSLAKLQSDLRQKHKVIRNLRPLDQSRLILYLSKRARGTNEIGAMAPHIAALWIINRPDIELPTLVEKFDQLLRLWNMPVEDSAKLADQLTVLAQRSPTSLDDLMDGLIEFRKPLR